MSIQSTQKEALAPLRDAALMRAEVRESQVQSGEHPTSSIPPPPKGDGSLLWRIGGIVRTIRPHQWVKNVFVLAPVIFAKEITDMAMLGRAAGAFVVFCLLAGAVYTINDIADLESDRLHPYKRYRPIASGRVPVGFARGLAIALVVIALFWAWLGPFWFLVTAAGYFGLNVAYSNRLKHVAYVDVVCIATGFVLRVIGGGFATHTEVSKYLLLCTALLALFLGFGKRRHELTTAEAGRAGRQRVVLESYTKRGLDVALAVTAGATLLTYVAYTLDPHTRVFFKNDWLWLSTVLVVLGIVRFLHLVRHRPRAESPTQEMLKDGPFVAIVLVWAGSVLWVVYNLRPSG